eukprot:gene4507-14667_t
MADWARGVVLTTSGLPKALRKHVESVISHAGGRYTADLSQQVTHICCDPLHGSTDTEKLRNVVRNRHAWKQPLVSLEWLVACKSSGRSVDERAFCVSVDNSRSGNSQADSAARCGDSVATHSSTHPASHANTMANGPASTTRQQPQVRPGPTAAAHVCPKPPSGVTNHECHTSFQNIQTKSDIRQHWVDLEPDSEPVNPDMDVRVAAPWVTHYSQLPDDNIQLPGVALQLPFESELDRVSESPLELEAQLNADLAGEEAQPRTPWRITFSQQPCDDLDILDRQAVSKPVWQLPQMSQIEEHGEVNQQQGLDLNGRQGLDLNQHEGLGLNQKHGLLEQEDLYMSQSGTSSGGSTGNVRERSPFEPVWHMQQLSQGPNPEPSNRLASSSSYGILGRTKNAELDPTSLPAWSMPSETIKTEPRSARAPQPAHRQLPCQISRHSPASSAGTPKPAHHTMHQPPHRVSFSPPTSSPVSKLAYSQPASHLIEQMEDAPPGPLMCQPVFSQAAEDLVQQLMKEKVQGTGDGNAPPTGSAPPGPPICQAGFSQAAEDLVQQLLRVRQSDPTSSPVRKLAYNQPAQHQLPCRISRHSPARSAGTPNPDQHLVHQPPPPMDPFSPPTSSPASKLAYSQPASHLAQQFDDMQQEISTRLHHDTSLGNATTPGPRQAPPDPQIYNPGFSQPAEDLVQQLMKAQKRGTGDGNAAPTGSAPPAPPKCQAGFSEAAEDLVQQLMKAQERAASNGASIAPPHRANTPQPQPNKVPLSGTTSPGPPMCQAGFSQAAEDLVQQLMKAQVWAASNGASIAPTHRANNPQPQPNKVPLSGPTSLGPPICQAGFSQAAEDLVQQLMKVKVEVRGTGDGNAPPTGSAPPGPPMRQAGFSQAAEDLVQELVKVQGNGDDNHRGPMHNYSPLANPIASLSLLERGNHRSPMHTFSPLPCPVDSLSPLQRQNADLDPSSSPLAGPVASLSPLQVLEVAARVPLPESSQSLGEPSRSCMPHQDLLAAVGKLAGTSLLQPSQSPGEPSRSYMSNQDLLAAVGKLARTSLLQPSPSPGKLPGSCMPHQDLLAAVGKLSKQFLLQPSQSPGKPSGGCLPDQELLSALGKLARTSLLQPSLSPGKLRGSCMPDLELLAAAGQQPLPDDSQGGSSDSNSSRQLLTQASSSSCTESPGSSAGNGYSNHLLPDRTSFSDFSLDAAIDGVAAGADDGLLAAVARQASRVNLTHAGHDGVAAGADDGLLAAVARQASRLNPTYAVHDGGGVASVVRGVAAGVDDALLAAVEKQTSMLNPTHAVDGAGVDDGLLAAVARQASRLNPTHLMDDGVGDGLVGGVAASYDDALLAAVARQTSGLNPTHATDDGVCAGLVGGGANVNDALLAAVARQASRLNSSHPADDGGGGGGGDGLLAALARQASRLNLTHLMDDARQASRLNPTHLVDDGIADGLLAAPARQAGKLRAALGNITNQPESRTPSMHMKNGSYKGIQDPRHSDSLARPTDSLACSQSRSCQVGSPSAPEDLKPIQYQHDDLDCASVIKGGLCESMSEIVDGADVQPWGGHVLPQSSSDQFQRPGEQGPSQPPHPPTCFADSDHVSQDCPKASPPPQFSQLEIQLPQPHKPPQLPSQVFNSQSDGQDAQLSQLSQPLFRFAVFTQGSEGAVHLQLDPQQIGGTGPGTSPSTREGTRVETSTSGDKGAECLHGGTCKEAVMDDDTPPEVWLMDMMDVLSSAPEQYEEPGGPSLELSTATCTASLGVVSPGYPRSDSVADGVGGANPPSGSTSIVRAAHSNMGEAPPRPQLHSIPHSGDKAGQSSTSLQQQGTNVLGPHQDGTPGSQDLDLLLTHPSSNWESSHAKYMEAGKKPASSLSECMPPTAMLDPGMPAELSARLADQLSGLGVEVVTEGNGFGGKEPSCVVCEPDQAWSWLSKSCSLFSTDWVTRTASPVQPPKT